MREMFVGMLRIRMVEEKLMELFSNGEIPGFIHVCIGQEAAPIAVCNHLKKYGATSPEPISFGEQMEIILF